MKRNWITGMLVLLFGVLAIPSTMNAGEIFVTKDTGTSTATYPYYRYQMRYQFIIDAADMKANNKAVKGKILEYEWMGGTAAFGTIGYSNITLKMGHSTMTSLTLGSTYATNYDSNGPTTVFNGNVSWNHMTNGDWHKFILDTPFEYNGVDNLVIEVVIPSPPTGTLYCYQRTEAYNSAGKRTIYSYNNSTNPTGSYYYYYPNYRLTVKGSSTWTGSASSDWNDPANWEGGEIPSYEQGAEIPDSSTTPNDPQMPDGIEIEEMAILPGARVEGSGGTVRLLGDWVNEGGTWIPNGTVIEYAGTEDQEILTGGSSIGNINVTNTAGTITVTDEFTASNTGHIEMQAGANMFFTYNEVNFTSASFDNKGTFHFGLDGGGTVATLHEVTTNGQNIGNVEIEVLSAMDEVEFIGDVGINDALLTGDGNVDFMNQLDITGDFTFHMGGVATITESIGQIQLNPNADYEGHLIVDGQGTLNVGEEVFLDAFTHTSTSATVIDIGVNAPVSPLSLFYVENDMRFESAVPTATVDIRLDLHALGHGYFDSAAPVTFAAPTGNSLFGTMLSTTVTGTANVTLNATRFSTNNLIFNSSATLAMNNGFSIDQGVIRGDGNINGSANGNSSLSDIELFDTTSINLSSGISSIYTSGYWVDNATGGTAFIEIIDTDSQELMVSTPGDRPLRARQLWVQQDTTGSAIPGLLALDGTIEVVGTGVYVDDVSALTIKQGSLLDFSNANAPTIDIEGTFETEAGPVKPRLLGSTVDGLRPAMNFSNINGSPACVIQGAIFENFGNSGANSFAVRFEATTSVVAFNDVEFRDIGQVDAGVVIETENMPSYISNFYMDGQAINNIDASAISGVRIDITEKDPFAGNRYGGGNEVDPNHVLVWENPPIMDITTVSVLPNALAENPYSTVIAVIGGNQPASFALANAPAFLSINPASGEITGTPTTADVRTYTFYVVATDISSPQQSKAEQFSLTVDALTDVAISIVTPVDLADGRVMEPYRYAFTAAGGAPGAFTWKLINPASLPAGLTFDENTGELWGTPTEEAAGVYNIAVRAIDAEGNSNIKTHRMTIYTEFSNPEYISAALNDGSGGGGCAIDGSSSSWLFALFLAAAGLVALRRRQEA